MFLKFYQPKWMIQKNKTQRKENSYCTLHRQSGERIIGWVDKIKYTKAKIILILRFYCYN